MRLPVFMGGGSQPSGGEPGNDFSMSSADLSITKARSAPSRRLPRCSGTRIGLQMQAATRAGQEVGLIRLGLQDEHGGLAVGAQAGRIGRAILVAGTPSGIGLKEKSAMSSEIGRRNRRYGSESLVHACFGVDRIEVGESQPADCDSPSAMTALICSVKLPSGFGSPFLGRLNARPA